MSEQENSRAAQLIARRRSEVVTAAIVYCDAVEANEPVKVAEAWQQLFASVVELREVSQAVAQLWSGDE